MVSGLPHAVSSGIASRVLPRFQPGCIAATAAIGSPPGDGDGEVVGETVGEGESVGDGGAVVPVGVGVLTPPVQATPLRVNEVGTGLLPVHDPLKPKETVPLVAIAAL